MATRAVKYSVTLTDRSGEWLGKRNSQVNNALKLMGNTIHNESLMVVPRKSGALAGSSKVVSRDRQVSVVYPKAYAGYQERGERYDGTHKVRRYTTPGTGKHYLKNTGDRVVERGIRWFLSHS